MGIRRVRERSHAKASERYVDVVFSYEADGVNWEGSVPIEYRRTGVHAKSEDEIESIVQAAYEAMRPSLAPQWIADQKAFWDTRRADVTRLFFDALLDSRWKCV